MAEEHPFASFVRILGRGKSFQRALTEAEAEEAMTMILAGDVRPEQLGAFLMLMRVKEETGEEVAGFVRAVRKTFERPAGFAGVDLDWSCYAGKKRQLPWFILSVLALVDQGVRVFMHGVEGHTPGRIYAPETMRFLGLPMARDLSQAAAQIDAAGLSYLPLDNLCPTLHDIIELRPVLGLRSPAHTIGRLLNPFEARYQAQGIFHPGYNEIHQMAAACLGQPHMAVFRGEGGEIERRPHKPVDVLTVHDGVLATEEWPALMPEPRQPHDADMRLERLVSVWRGATDDDYGAAAVTGTLAIALRLLGRADSVEAAEALATEVWAGRNRARLDAVA